MRFRIESVGYYEPATVQTAEELAPLVGKSAAWIRDRTGVGERRIADRSMAEMGAIAAQRALGDGEPPDLILNASLSPVQLIPDSSTFIQRELGFEGIPSFSIHATCLSFLVAVHTAGGLLASGAYKRILVVSSEHGSMSRDFSHPESAVLIGDGAAAAVLVPTPEGESSELLHFKMTTWPSGIHLAEFQGAGTRFHPNAVETNPSHNLFRMHGPGIYKKAVLKVARLVRELLAEAGIEGDDLDLVVPHQASGPALKTLPRFGLPADKVINIVGTHGNCIAASLPMALAMAVEQGRVHRGDTVLLLGTGAGLSVAGLVMRW